VKSPGIKNIRWVVKPILHILLLFPAVSLVYGFFAGTIGINPVETMTQVTGEWGLRILLLSLAITPLARITRSGWLIQLRRLVGLYCFFYALLHFSIYLVFDLSLDFGFLVEDILERPYITVGFLAFIILTLLAITSPIRIRQKMANTLITWNRLHQLVYAVGILAIVHFLWITRVEDTEPLIYALVLSLLLGYRIHIAYRKSLKRQPNSSALYQ
jgi:sulfoxide reductase heme-binding subunit YedZ